MLDALSAVTGNLGRPGGGVSFYTRRRAAFDLSFLDAELAKLGRIRPAAESKDTVGLSRRAFPGRASYRLGAIAGALGIDAGSAHRALDDARTCMLLYLACARQLR